MSDAEARPLDDTKPCVGCGLCCDGTLFVRAAVTPGEEDRLIEYGLKLIKFEGKTHFLEPCPHQSCGRCMVYNERFDICRTFRCALLRRYQSGEIDLREARAKVEGALKLVAEIKSEQPKAGLYAERIRLHRELAQQVRSLNQSERAPTARRLLKLAALDFYLDQWFRNKKDQVETERDASGSNSRRKTPTDKVQISPDR